MAVVCTAKDECHGDGTQPDDGGLHEPGQAEWHALHWRDLPEREVYPRLEQQQLEHQQLEHRQLEAERRHRLFERRALYE